jgi:hypothetical protein
VPLTPPVPGGIVEPVPPEVVLVAAPPAWGGGGADRLVPPEPAAFPTGGAELLPPVFATVGTVEVLHGGTVHVGDSFDALEHATTDTKLMVV